MSVAGVSGVGVLLLERAAESPTARTRHPPSVVVSKGLTTSVESFRRLIAHEVEHSRRPDSTMKLFKLLNEDVQISLILVLLPAAVRMTLVSETSEDTNQSLQSPLEVMMSLLLASTGRMSILS